MEPPLEPSQGQAKRHDCVGVSYFSAWMRTHGQAPVCVGFSQVTSDSQAPEPGSAAQPGTPDQGASDFKHVCIGYSSYSHGTPSLPHCEGLELVVEQASHTAHMHWHLPVNMIKAPTTTAQQVHQLSGTKQQATASPEQPVPLKFLSKVSQNWDLLMAAARNEGPVKLKTVPRDWQELQERVVETVHRNTGRMSTAAGRLAASAYSSTLKPLGIILGIVPRPKS